MSIDKKFKVTEIQRFCMHDGPGVRTTVFFKGCPLKCAWCHNPETQNPKSEVLFYPSKCIFCKSCESICEKDAHTLSQAHNFDREKCISCFNCVDDCPTNALEICGNDMTVDEILAVVEKDRAFYGDLGGITLSGGEPFMQGAAIVDLLIEAKNRGFSTAIETCGYINGDVYKAAIPYTDIFLWDIKDTDCARHEKFTGVDNALILKNLSLANEKNAKIRIRCILVNGINTDETHYGKIAEIARGINNLDGVEIIPYHAYAGTKATFLGKEDNGNVNWIPTPIQIEEAKAFIREKGIKLI